MANPVEYGMHNQVSNAADIIVTNERPRRADLVVNKFKWKHTFDNDGDLVQRFRISSETRFWT